MEQYANELVLVTGANGSIGTHVTKLLRDVGCTVLDTDIQTMNVRKWDEVITTFYKYKPTIVLHLAGAKHAPAGEENPMLPVEAHIDGTSNVLNAASAINAQVVTASTCKACNPETAYGATKLVAERLTLNANQVVARFHNVVETAGNVFQIWENTIGPVLVAGECKRYFITLDEAAGLVLFCGLAEHGRYIVNPGKAQKMDEVAARLYPERNLEYISKRRGDRLKEPLIASDECFVDQYGSVLKVESAHDRVRVML